MAKRKSATVRKDSPPPLENIDLEGVPPGLAGKITWFNPNRFNTQFKVTPPPGIAPHGAYMELHFDGDYANPNYDAIFSVLLLAMSRNSTVEIQAMSDVVHGQAIPVKGVIIAQPLDG